MKTKGGRDMSLVDGYVSLITVVGPLGMNQWFINKSCSKLLKFCIQKAVLF